MICVCIQNMILLQKNVGQEFMVDVYFNPVQDINNNWFISVEEMDQCVNENFMWVKDLELIDYEPKLFIDIE